MSSTAATWTPLRMMSAAAETAPRRSSKGKTAPGACNTATAWISALVPRMVPGTRVYTAIGLCFIPLLGAVPPMTLPSEGAEWGIVVSTWLGACSPALLSSSASLVASNVKGNTKNSVVSVAFFIAYCVGCIVSPFAWTSKDPPRYAKGCILSVSSMIALIITYIVFVIVVKRKNASRDAKAVDGQVQYVVEGLGGSQQAGVSTDSYLTDVQDKGFRYTI